MPRIERRAAWTSEQLEHRAKGYRKLPAVPTKHDLEAVAARLLSARSSERERMWTLPGPPPAPDPIDMVVGYGLTCKMRLPAVADTIEEARYQALQVGARPSLPWTFKKLFWNTGFRPPGPSNRRLLRVQGVTP